MIIEIGEDLLSRIYMNELSWKYIMGVVLVDYSLTAWTHALVIGIIDVCILLMSNPERLDLQKQDLESDLEFFYSSGKITIVNTDLTVTI